MQEAERRRRKQRGAGFIRDYRMGRDEEKTKVKKKRKKICIYKNKVLTLQAKIKKCLTKITQ